MKHVKITISLVGILLFYVSGIFAQAPLLFETSFEKNEPLSASGNSPEIIIMAAREGSHALKSQLNESCSTSYRTEFTMNGEYPNYSPQKEYWLGISIMVDPDYQGTFPENDKAMFLQWHYRTWLYSKDAVRAAQPLLLRWDDKKVNVQSETLEKLGIVKGYLYSGPPAYGEWVDWVFNVKFSETTSGFFKVYRNGVQVVNYSGPNHFEEFVDGAYLKLGIYSSQYKRRPTRPFTRTVYHDCIRIAGPNTGSYVDVAPRN